MSLGDIFRKFPTDDEDLKVTQMLGMRIFNAFGASLKLALSGYHQNAALLLRDVLETVFLLDLFGGDQTLITRWRLADDKSKRQHFSPAAVRKALDVRYGHTTRKREEQYRLFSELAGHPTMKSSWMMRPRVEGDAVIGPFMEKLTLEAVVSEMGKLAVQAGQHLTVFFPQNWKPGEATNAAFVALTQHWLETFYAENFRIEAHHA